MIEFKLWCVYTGYLEQWTRETGEKIASLVNNNDVSVTVEYFDESDPRVSLYGWSRFPLFVAVKYDQPFQKKIGKNNWDTYIEWVRTLGWNID